MASYNRNQEDRNRYDRENRRPGDRHDRQQNIPARDLHSQSRDDWPRQVPDNRERGPYRDYGWERGESALPEFRDSSVHVAPYERQEMGSDRNISWNDDYNYGVVEDGPFSGVGPKGYQRSDERIFEEVCERLTRHGQIDAREMQVSVENGEVTLRGFVRDRQTKRLAEMVSEKVRGVTDVHNTLRVQMNQASWGQDSGRTEPQPDNQTGQQPTRANTQQNNAAEDQTHIHNKD